MAIGLRFAAVALGVRVAALGVEANGGVGAPNASAGVRRPLAPIRGIAYGALPCTEWACGGHGLPSEDMLQAGYQGQWGPAGRNDLGTMRRLGANAVRLYHSLGLHVDRSHAGFLDRAHALGLNVLPGYHTESANYPNECPEYDCFETWKAATLQGFQHGFRHGSDWHPAVAMLILLNEPDFFEGAPKCVPSGAWCRTRAMISALDGVLAAEREAGVSAGRVKFTVTWSFAMRESVDGTVNGPGLFGFQDIVAVLNDLSLARNYTSRTPVEELQEAFNTRWVHGLNTQAPWNFVNELISRDYARFAPIPWFVGEYGANGQPEEVIRGDLEAMERAAVVEGSNFMGAAMFQFQTAYYKGGSEMNFGLFGLGEETLGEMDLWCEKDQPGCRAWPVHCLTTELSFLPGALALRAQAVAGAWGGVVPNGKGFCNGSRRLLVAADADWPTSRIHADDDAAFEDGAAHVGNDFGADPLSRSGTSGDSSSVVEPVPAHASSAGDTQGFMLAIEPEGVLASKGGEDRFGGPKTAQSPWWSRILFGAAGGFFASAVLAKVVLRASSQQQVRALCSSRRGEKSQSRRMDASTQV